MAPGDLFSMIDDKSPALLPALKLLQVYAREGDRDLLRNYYYQDDRRLDSACLDMEEAGATEVSRCHHVMARSSLQPGSICFAY